MRTIYKPAQHIEKYAKTLETKTLNRGGKSLSFSGIERMLLQNATLCLHDGTVFELDENIFETNKQKTKQYLNTNY